MTTLLAEALLHPQLVAGLSAPQQSHLLALGRCSGLLTALAARLEDTLQLEKLPVRLRRHFESALIAHAKQRRDLQYELSKLRPVFAQTGLRLILLKGTAYIAGDLQAGRGRLVSDIDLLTPRAGIGVVEAALRQAGWQSAEKSDYDDHYYRAWMHEIPPMQHSRRGSVLDVHHTILPPTSRPTIHSEHLFEGLRELQPGVYGLGPETMLLHSIAHLFFESEFPQPLRDLWDQHCLIEEFANSKTDFWSRLVERARELDLATPTWLALRYREKLFARSAPHEVTVMLQPGAAMLRTTYWDWLFHRVFSVNHYSSRPPMYSAALALMYLRGHALRMPARLLIPHLMTKALARWRNAQLKTEHPS